MENRFLYSDYERVFQLLPLERGQYAEDSTTGVEIASISFSQKNEPDRHVRSNDVHFVPTHRNWQAMQAKQCKDKLCEPFRGTCSSKNADQTCDYRTVPVLPTTEDILSPCTSLRPNLIKGRYEDGKHYLAVQFSLCREDYVKPIRDGVAEYLNLKQQGKSLTDCKNVNVYTDVHIIEQEFVHEGLVHLARFSDQKFSRIKWENSKRFLTGSLLCLSSDDFRTVLFATVVRRQPKELRKGIVLLRFEEITDEVLTLTNLKRFVVIETSAYFEAYRHNLRALQEIEADNLPMKSHIVEVQKYILEPAYMTQPFVYDIRPLLLPLNQHSIREFFKESESGKLKTEYMFDLISDEGIARKAQSVSIVSDQSWPSVSELNLDHDQYAAIKAALTKRFVLIQGPPGTGKTYVGLRIVQLLLHNSRVRRNDRPILVVCHTNHALDQFLEGVLQFTREVVRVGGRGTNEVISHFQLHSLRKVMENKKKVPNHLHKLIQQRKHEVRSLVKCIYEMKQDAEMRYSTVLSVDILKDYMSPKHEEQMKWFNNLLKNEEFSMKFWLGFRREDDVTCKNDQMVINGRLAKENENEVDCDETEVEYLEAFRSMTSEEFDDFKIDELIKKDEVSQESNGCNGKSVRDTLIRTNAMTEEEVKNVRSITSLSSHDRCRLYKFWLELHIAEKQKEMLTKQTSLKTKLAELNELQSEVDLLLCLPALVIGMTSTGAAKYRNIVQRLKPQVVVFEEAAEILESHIVTSLTPSTDHVILIGDHQQLKPSPSVHELAIQYDLNVSLFERMVQNDVPCYKLSVQHRMRPEISALLVPHFYEDLKNHMLVTKYENMKGVKKNVFFVSHSNNELHEHDSKSKVNQHEATFLIKLCKYILLQGYAPSQITILTTYSGQLLVLKRLAGDGIPKGVKFTVVDNYQGEENDIILVSFVRSNEEGEIGFLKVPNRVCVALSRAKKALYCIGNFDMLVEKSPFWKSIVNILEENQAIGPSLHLFCQNHPDVSIAVTYGKDFSTLREGGCTRVCEFRLACGHSCHLSCHPYDREHENVKCSKPCARECAYGHSCKKMCFEDCGPCSALVERKMEQCSHIINIECKARHSKEQKCTARCSKILACTHQCPNICSSDCTTKCLTEVEILSPLCGHPIQVECCKSDDREHIASICRKPCNSKLSCGHECQGTCSECHQGRIHRICSQPCEVTLFCGHKCTSSCSRSCPPCTYPCENYCSHGRCPKRCGEPCVKCYKPCEWSCPHKKCDQYCYQKCSRGICYEPCLKKLDCGHSCIGLCGEICPEVCRECHDLRNQRTFFYSTHKEDCRYVVLEDCKHSFELSDFERWIKAVVIRSKIWPIPCPKCRAVVRKNPCFEQHLKSWLEDVELVKEAIYGSIFKNFYVQNCLLEKIVSNIDKIKYIYDPIVKALKSIDRRSLMEIRTMDNLFTLAVLLADATDFLDDPPKVRNFKYSQVQKFYQSLIEYMKLNRKLLIKFMQDEYLTFGDSQLLELNWEITRLKLASTILTFIDDKVTLNVNVTELKSLADCIISYKPFRENRAKTCVASFEALMKCFSGCHFMDISYLVRPIRLNVMDLSQKQWYKCDSNHICLSSEREFHCSECGLEVNWHCITNDSS